MANHNGVITRSPSEDPTVTNMVLNVTHNGTLRNGSDRQYISYNEIGLFATIDELASVHAFSGHEQLLLMLVAKRVTEGNSGEWSASTRVVDDIGDDALEVAIAFTEVEAAEASWTLAVVGVGLED